MVFLAQASKTFANFDMFLRGRVCHRQPRVSFAGQVARPSADAGGGKSKLGAGSFTKNAGPLAPPGGGAVEAPRAT